MVWSKGNERQDEIPITYADQKYKNPETYVTVKVEKEKLLQILDAKGENVIRKVGRRVSQPERIKQYKTEKCPYPRSKCFLGQRCPHFYTENDRRRKTNKFIYSPVRCFEKMSTRFCKRGDNCPYSQNMYEAVYHSFTYKTKPCRNKDCNNNPG